MSPVQIIRTVATALITGGGALGLVPTGPCGAGWWAPSRGEAAFGWFAYGEAPPNALVGGCETAMAPVGVVGGRVDRGRGSPVGGGVAPHPVPANGHTEEVGALPLCDGR